MHTLHLLRHVKSSWDFPGVADQERPLAPRGLKAARRLALYIAARRIEVDLVLCSTAARAHQTVVLIRPSLGKDVKISFEDELYAADATVLLDRLRQLDESTQTVLLVAHSPGLEQLALDLAADGNPQPLELMRQKFPTGALATITTESPWSELGPRTGYLEAFVTPRALKRL